MKIIMNTPVTSNENIYIIDTQNDIEINADLISTAGNVYVVGKNVFINQGVKIRSETNEAKITGLENTNNLGDVYGRIAHIGSTTYPANLLNGINISANVQQYLVYQDS